jgi:hypothetical protein
MYKELLRSIAGIEVFPVISLCLFVAVFALMLIRVWRLDRPGLSHMAALPLDRPVTVNPDIATKDKGARL